MGDEKKHSVWQSVNKNGNVSYFKSTTVLRSNEPESYTYQLLKDNLTDEEATKLHFELTYAEERRRNNK